MSVFPAFIRLEHQRDGSAKSSFLAEVAATTQGAERAFKASFSEISRIIDTSLAGFRDGRFKLDLDLTGLRQAANDATFARERLVALRDAATDLARAENDNSEATHQYLNALRAQVTEAQQAEQAAQRQVSVYTRMQAEIDRTAAANARLADSYRATFAEEARAANAAHRSQQTVNALAAPGLTRKATDNGAGYGALAELVRAQDEAERAVARTTAEAQAQQAELNRLRQVEAGAAEGTRLLAAAHAGTALALDHTSRSARESAAAFELLFQAQAARTEAATQGFLNQALGIDRVGKSARDSARAFEELFAAQDRLASDLNAVRAAIDPTYLAQQRLDTELERAQRVFAAGAIDARQYGLAVNAAADSFQSLVLGARAGTTAFGNVINSVGAMRQASLQAGQQLQDVAISLYSGQNAAVVFAQQVPQLAFALTGLEGSANKTANRVGQLASFLSSAQGFLAIGAAVGVLALLVNAFKSSGDAAEAATRKLRDNANEAGVAREAQDKFSRTIEGQTEALLKNAEAMGKMNQLQQTSGEAALEAAEKLAVKTLQTRRDTEALLIAAIEQERYNNSLSFSAGVDESAGLIIRGRSAERTNDLAKALQKANQATRDAQQQVIGARSYVAVERGLESQEERITRAYDERIDSARRLAVEQGKTADQLERQVRTLREARDADLERLRAANKTRSPRDPGELTSFISPVSGGRLTGQFGEQRPGHRHAGVDFAVPIGTPVRAPAGGTIIEAGTVGSYGKVVFIDHGGGTITRLAHLDKIGVVKGQAVTQGEVIGASGNTGRSTGPHLHQETRVNGRAVNPLTGRFPTDELGIAVDDFAEEQKAAAKLEELGERSAAAIQAVNRQFGEQPRFVKQSEAAVAELDQRIADLQAQNTEGVFDSLIAQAKATRDVVAAAPYREAAQAIADIAQESQRRLEIETLLLHGREAEAKGLQQIWQIEERLVPLTDEQKQNVLAIAQAEERRGEAIQRAKEIQDAYLDATRSIRGEVEAILSGQGKFSNFKQIFRRLQGRVLTEQLFGDTFRQLEKSILRDTGIEPAVDKLSSETGRASDAIAELANAATAGAQQIAGGAAGGAPAGLLSAFDATFGGGRAGGSLGGGLAALGALVGGGAANDNAGQGVGAGAATFSNFFAASGAAPITVNAKLPKGTVAGSTLSEYQDNLVGGFTRSPLGKAIDSLLPGASKVAGGAFFGYQTGGYAGGVIGALKGIKGLPGAVDKLFGASNVLGKAAEGAATGTAIAGIGKALGIKTSTTGAQIGGAIGSALPIPGGQVIGSILGGLVGGLFKKTKKGSATLGFVGGELGVVGTSGNSGSRKEAASTAAGSIAESINNIAEQLGGVANGAIGVSIGIRKKSYRVDTTGRGRTKGAGVLDFGEDQEAALKAAVADAIRDGVITGLKAGTQRLIQNGDIEKQLQKALDFESVFTRLRAHTDPVGAALEALNKEFTRLKGIFAEAGASAAEYADLEKLYGIERANAVKQATEQIGGSLRSLLDDLGVNNDARSLRERQSLAQIAYAPLEARIKAGDATAVDDFVDAARTLTDIQRQISGSQSDYFSLVDSVTATAGGQLDRLTAIANASAAADSPFSTTSATKGVSDNAGVVNAINTQTDTLTAGFAAVNDNLGAIIGKFGISNGAFVPDISFANAF